MEDGFCKEVGSRNVQSWNEIGNQQKPIISRVGTNNIYGRKVTILIERKKPLRKERGKQEGTRKSVEKLLIYESTKNIENRKEWQSYFGIL